VSDALRKALSLFTTHRISLDALTRLLSEKETVYGQEIEKILKLPVKTTPAAKD
jgi:ATP-dependent Zn protease